MQFWVVFSVVTKGQFWVVIRVVKKRQCWWLLVWLKRGSFGVVKKG